MGERSAAPDIPSFRKPARVLVIAGSDSSGGAGIQADVKAITRLGGYAGTAVTALTAQDTRGVRGIIATPPPFVVKQMAAFMDDIGVDAVKTGMLFEPRIVEAVVDRLASCRGAFPVVVDPVMGAQSGASLADDGLQRALINRLLPLATVVTPNLPEAETMLGRPVRTQSDMVEGARQILKFGSGAVLLKGGHLSGNRVCDVLVSARYERVWDDARIESRGDHGTGCTLASALAVVLAQGQPLEEAVTRARDYVREALASAPGLGRGRGPLGLGEEPPETWRAVPPQGDGNVGR